MRERDIKRKAEKCAHLRAGKAQRAMWRCRAAESEKIKLYSQRPGYRERKEEGAI